MLGSTQSLMVRDAYGSSWLVGRSELTKSKEIHAVCYHYIKGKV